MKVFLLFVLFTIHGLQLAIAQRISLGFAHTLAICIDSSCQAWGRDIQGQLGDSITTPFDFPDPVQVATFEKIISVACGQEFSLALTAEGKAMAWGGNLGTLGDGTLIDRNIPTYVHIVGPIKMISAGWQYSLFLKADSTVWACGVNTEGEIGDGTDSLRTIPVRVNTLSGIVAISSGQNHSLALKSDGTVWSWGYNAWGQLGNGTTINANSPSLVNNLSSVVAVSAGGGHSLALKNDGTLWAWGLNASGELGDGTNTNRLYPVPITAISGISNLACGTQHTLAIKNDTLWSWGSNHFGELGNNSTSNSYVPIQITTMAGVESIAASLNYSISLKHDGTFWAWGNNAHGQLGDGSFLQRHFPVHLQNVCNLSTGTNENGTQRDRLNIYPNPTTSTFTVTLPNHSSLLNSQLKIVDVTGRVVHEQILNQPSSVINRPFSAGVYFVKVSDGEKVFTQKLVVQ